MNEDSTLLSRRRRFLTGVGIVATGATLAASAQAASGQRQHRESDTGFNPARHDLDAWMDIPGTSHRAFIDSSTGNGGAAALNYANNVLLGHREAYGGSDTDYGLIVCFRHMSTPI